MPKNEVTKRAASIDASEKWKKLGEKRVLYIPFIFINEASKDQNPLASYGLTNVEKLKTMPWKCDASQLFQTLQNGRFLLSKI